MKTAVINPQRVVLGGVEQASSLCNAGEVSWQRVRQVDRDARDICLPEVEFDIVRAALGD